ncbi:MAG TPA: hypothetical protein VFG48_08245, partial [Xanthomonadales bacterium]|nr:hypothetical protein [Xanthomonadales bacterium]
MHLKFRTSQVYVLALAAFLAAGTLALSWPRLQASLRFLPVDIAIERYYQDRQIPSHRMLTLIGFAEEALARNDHYRYH